ncbi:hypothetical protein [Actinocorallia longicatena]|uniref:Uncharacterized protein n=1 Tax=Actinocorallia longicatena TaxID=111803 RepID=A0ABP6QI48_9ACTN
MSEPVIAESKHPRDLLDGWVIDHLAERAGRRGHDRNMALRLIDMALVFLVACGENTGAKLSPPSDAIDEVWHDLITCTNEYALFCDAMAGRFIHHRPIVNDDITSGRAHTRTIAAMRSTGLPIDEELLIGSPRCMNTCNHPCSEDD